MQGLIFVTWEKYLKERFGNDLLLRYRDAIGETPATSPLYSHVYSDEILLAGVGAACKLTRLTADTLLREYGHYFIINGLTRHLCAYLLNRVTGGRQLLLTMSEAHAQMRRTPDALTPPLFEYEALPGSSNGLVVLYESPRKLCSVLIGCFEGAAERYGERVRIVERTCMKQGAAQCRFEIRFFPGSSVDGQETYEQMERRQVEQLLENLVISALPGGGGVTLAELQSTLHYWQARPDQLRPGAILKALNHLSFAGLVATSANEPGDTLAIRRYWRVPTRD